MIYQTNVMIHTRSIIQGQSRSKTTYKWRNILEHFLHQQSEIVVEQDADDEHDKW